MPIRVKDEKALLRENTLESTIPCTVLFKRCSDKRQYAHGYTQEIASGCICIDIFCRTFKFKGMEMTVWVKTECVLQVQYIGDKTNKYSQLSLTLQFSETVLFRNNT